MEKIKVIDDFLPKFIQDKIEHLATDHEHIRYIFASDTGKHAIEGSQYQDGIQLVNLFVDDGKLVYDDASHYLLLPLQVACFQEQLYFKLQNVLRAKTNITLQQQSTLDKFINPPHRDTELENSLIGIYYINDSDGDTIIYNSNLEPIKNVSPKKGRMLFMDGKVYHSASHPLKTDKRMVINYNLIL